MPALTVSITEKQIVKTILEYLEKRNLNISLLSLERESGVINGNYSDDMLFLRQLILDGQWDDVIEFIQPLTEMKSFDYRKFQYIMYKHKYIELLCLKSELENTQNYDGAVEEVVKCVNKLESLCSSKEEFNKLCLMMSAPNFGNHPDYVDWNPSNARVGCFKEIHSLVEHFLVPEKSKQKETTDFSMDDRLVQLIVKGMLYESCVNFCHKRAICNDEEEETDEKFKLSGLFSNTGLSDSDISLVSWLQVKIYWKFSIVHKLIKSVPISFINRQFQIRHLNVHLIKKH